MAVRTCGGCTRCCEIVPVGDIGKRSYERCPAQRDMLSAAGPGCGIYPSRPRACRDWSCVWLTNPELPDELRPDRCGLVIDPIVDLVRLDGEELPTAQIWVSPGHEDDFRREIVTGLIVGLLEQVPIVLWRLPVGADRRSFSRGIMRDKSTGELNLGAITESNFSIGTERERFARVDQLMAARQGRR